MASHCHARFGFLSYFRAYRLSPGHTDSQIGTWCELETLPAVRALATPHAYQQRVGIRTQDWLFDGCHESIELQFQSGPLYDLEEPKSIGNNWKWTHNFSIWRNSNWRRTVRRWTFRTFSTPLSLDCKVLQASHRDPPDRQLLEEGRIERLKDVKESVTIFHEMLLSGLRNSSNPRIAFTFDLPMPKFILLGPEIWGWTIPTPKVQSAAQLASPEISHCLFHPNLWC